MAAVASRRSDSSMAHSHSSTVPVAVTNDHSVTKQALKFVLLKANFRRDRIRSTLGNIRAGIYELCHLDGVLFVIEECRHLANGCTAKCIVSLQKPKHV